MAEQVGPKKAREMWFMARFYTASEAEKMGLVNTVVPVSCFALEKELTSSYQNCILILQVTLFN